VSDHDKKAPHPEAIPGCLGTKGLSLPWYHPSLPYASRRRPSKVWRDVRTRRRYHTWRNNER